MLSLFLALEEDVNKLNFYTVDRLYVDFLKSAELEKRGFSRVPDMQYASSLRFNYMFPIPLNLAIERKISTEPDDAYRALLSQELRYCVKNQELIRKMAQRTYKRVIIAKNPGLVANSCDFKLLEEKCIEYISEHQ